MLWILTLFFAFCTVLIHSSAGENTPNEDSRKKGDAKQLEQPQVHWWFISRWIDDPLMIHANLIFQKKDSYKFNLSKKIFVQISRYTDDSCKFQEQHNKLMTSFRSLLSTEVSFMSPSMVGITHLDKFGERGHASLHVSFLVIGYLGTIALIMSHSADVMKWSVVLSFSTVVVTVHWLDTLYLSMASSIN